MGERFGDYEIEGRLGAGGMAEVFVATRRGAEGFQKRVCLKRVLPGEEGDRALTQQLQDEARVAALLHHPAIASVYDFGEVDGKWFLTMELVDGIDLRTLFTSLKQRREPVPIDVGLYVLAQIAEALAYAHDLALDGSPLGLVHRDVTPSNVLLSVHGEVKLADFGIARTSIRSHQTATGIVKGKVPYMAPEQALGDPLDRRTDLFALGIVAYELLGGRRPHDGATDLETLTNAQRTRRPKLSALRPDVPAAIEALVERMLAPKPEGRPASAAEVADAIHASGTSASARRVLASMVEVARDPFAAARRDVEATRGGPSRAPVDDGPTEIAAAPAEVPAQGARTPAVTPAPRAASGPWPRWIPMLAGIALALVGGVAVLAVGVLAFAGDRIADAIASTHEPAATEAESAVPTATPLVDAGPADAPKPPELATLAAPPPPPATVATTDEAPRHHGRHAHRAAPHDDAEGDASYGRLSVVVVPFGDVSLDGRAIGRAPLSTTVTAGPHTLTVDSAGRHAERHVTVTAGGSERVVVDLLESP
jgi:hypothetical protein